jgi:hypothetical protein
VSQNIEKKADVAEARTQECHRAPKCRQLGAGQMPPLW